MKSFASGTLIPFLSHQLRSRGDKIGYQLERLSVNRRTVPFHEKTQNF
jgi:hypothetical protein